MIVFQWTCLFLQIMDTIQAEVEIEIGSVAPRVVPPDIDGRHPPPPPPTLHPPASSVGTQPSTVSSSALSTAPSSFSTAGPTRPAPPGLQLGHGPFLGTASTSVTHSGFSYMAPPAPTATLGGWNQPAFTHSFGQQLPWTAFPLVSVTTL